MFIANTSLPSLSESIPHVIIRGLGISQSEEPGISGVLEIQISPQVSSENRFRS